MSKFITWIKTQIKKFTNRNLISVSLLCETSVRELKKLDTDKDGYITLKELLSGIKPKVNLEKETQQSSTI